MSSVKVLVLGHSHVYWLGAFAGSTSPSGLFADFSVRGHACDVRYLGLRGATASSLRAPAVRSQIASFGADVVVLHVGRNDLDGKSAPDPCMVAGDLQRFASELLAMGVSRFAVCQVVRRQRWRNFSFEEGAARVIALNAELESLCKGVDGMFFWRHKRLWNSIRVVFRRDGVHFSDIGNYRFFRSIRGAIMKAANQFIG